MDNSLGNKVKNQIVQKKTKLIIAKNLIFSKIVKIGIIIGTVGISYFYLKWQLFEYIKQSEENIENELKQLRLYIERNYKINRGINSVNKKSDDDFNYIKEKQNVDH